ncbi:hypothetical protein, partial [Listeria welshimeri]|uniref:hypothetical protein n=1 Tax=Listeria welshimeri TaxID=1643 RepID=UPI001887E41A
ESFEGSVVKPIGMVNLMCKFKNIKSFENFIILDCKSMLLGLPGCISLNLVKRVNNIESKIDELKDKFIQEHQSVFQGVGKLPGTYSIVTKQFDQQICYPPSRIPNCLVEPLKSELNRLESRKSIVKVDNIHENSCINRIVLVEKPNKKARLCLDPSDLNKYIHKLLTLKQKITKAYHDRTARGKEVKFKTGDQVVYRTEQDSHWKKGIIVSKCKEPRSYMISKNSNTRPFRRNSFHLRKSYSDVENFTNNYVPIENDLS